MLKTTSSFIFAALLFATPAMAASCPATGGFLARVDAIAASSSSCRAALQNTSGNKRSMCNTCRVTQAKLIALRQSYKANKKCLGDDPKFRARINQLFAYNNDVKKLRRLCGG